MDKRLIEEKLESLRRCIRRIEEKRPSLPDILQKDPDLQDIITLNLTRAVQLCVDIAAHILSEAEVRAPATMGEAFELMADLGILDAELEQRMKKAVGFRNIAIHNYGEVNWQIVHSLCHHNLEDFRNFAQAAERLLSDSAS